MVYIADSEPLRRRAVNLTIREDVIEEAKALKLNASRAAESGLVKAIRDARAEEWLERNRGALAAHNTRVEKVGPLLTPDWLDR